MFQSKNTKKQGDVGLGAAIAWFVANEYVVSIPLTDSQDYDLIVEKDNTLYRVQVKTTSYKSDSGSYSASLTVKGGNRSGKNTIKDFDKSKVEIVFVLADNGQMWVVPTQEMIGNNSIALGRSYDKFLKN